MTVAGTQSPKLKHTDLWMEFWRDEDSAEAMTRLIEAWMPLVQKILKRIVIRLPTHVQVEDLLQSAVVALHRVILRYDPERKVGFESFAYHRIRGAILDELRSNDHMSRRDRTALKKLQEETHKWTAKHGRPPTEEELAQLLSIDTTAVAKLLDRAKAWISLDQAVISDNGGQKMCLQDIVADPNSPVPDQESHREDMRTVLRSAFRQLTTKEQKVLYLYYFEELRLSEIAGLFELTEARICQIHSLAIIRLKAILQKTDPDDFPQGTTALAKKAASSRQQRKVPS